MAGLIDLVRNGDIGPDSTVLYAHLGGQPAINAYSRPVRRRPCGSSDASRRHLRRFARTLALVAVVAAYLAVGPWVLLVALLLLLVPRGAPCAAADLAAAAGARRWSARGGRRGAGDPGRPAADPARRRAAGDPGRSRAGGDAEADQPRPARSTRSWRPTAAAPCTTTAGRPTPTPARARWASDPEVDSAWYGVKECATLAFDSAGPDRRRSAAASPARSCTCIDPDSMEPLDTLELPRRTGNTGKRPWEDLCGGAYFYLDRDDRAFVGTTRRTDRRGGHRRDLTVERTIDLTDVIPDDDCLVALMPDWDGLGTWWVTQDGRVGHADEAGESDRRRPRRGDRQLDLGRRRGPLRRHGRGALQARGSAPSAPETIWRTAYDNGTEQKPGQLSAGSGTTPTVLPSGLVAITDNAEPRMNVQFYDAGRRRAWCARRRCSRRPRAPATTRWSRSARPASWSRTTTATTAR